MLTRFFLTLLCIFYWTGVLAQESDPIGTDRPSQAPSAGLVNPGTFQFESGVIYRKFTNLSGVSVNSLWRVGINENFELRAFVDYLYETRDLDGEDSDESGWAPLQIGTKIKLTDGQGWIPQASLVAMLFLPTGEGSFQLDRTLPDLRITFANDVPGILDVFYSVGVIWEPVNYRPIGLYTFGTGITISERVWSFVEVYGYFNTFIPNPSLNGGFTWLASDNVKIDLTGGIDFPSDGGGFISTGISFRL